MKKTFREIVRIVDAYQEWNLYKNHIFDLQVIHKIYTSRAKHTLLERETIKTDVRETNTLLKERPEILCSQVRDGGCAEGARYAREERRGEDTWATPTSSSMMLPRMSSTTSADLL